MLFRLTNFIQPQEVVAVNISSLEGETTSRIPPGFAHVSSSVRKTANKLAILNVRDWESIACDVKDVELIVLKDIHKCKDIWRTVVDDERFSVTFDLYDVGLAFTRRDLNKQNYIVNW